MIQLYEAGHTYKVHGVRGELFIGFEAELKSYVIKTAVVFIKVDGNVIPYFIERISGNEDLKIKFKDVNSPEEARLLSNKMVYIDIEGIDPESIREEIPEEENGFIGFQMEDLKSGFKGRITQVEEFPSQLMCWVEKDQQEYMIPLHEDWIVEMNMENKIIKLNLPEGLF
jgi:16S rRNA processing protein RimM